MSRRPRGNLQKQAGTRQRVLLALPRLRCATRQPERLVLLYAACKKLTERIKSGSCVCVRRDISIADFGLVNAIFVTIQVIYSAPFILMQKQPWLIQSDPKER